MGLHCPSCGGATKIYDTRTFRDTERDFVYVVRKHRCLACEHKFKSMETYMELWQTLLTGEEDDDDDTGPV